MKKIIIISLILIICLSFACCKDNKPKNGNSFFTNEMGRKVFLNDETDYELEKEVSFPIQQGYHFSSYINNELYIAYSQEDISDSEGEKRIEKYGVFNRSGEAVIECKYESLFSSGNFIFGEYYTDDIEYKNDIFYINGNKILTTDYVINLVAISEDYCVLYYDEYSEVFDKDGVHYFSDTNKMSRGIRYSLCDDYLFGYDTECGDWFIWQLVVNNSGEHPYGFTLLKKIFEGGNSLFSVAYLGDDNFLVVETQNVSVGYDYFEVINGTTYYLKQKTSIYNVVEDTQKEYKSDYPILSIVNHYSPTLSLEQREKINIKKSYSQVNAGIVDEKGERVAYRFYVIDNKGNFVIRYPENMNPTAMRFIDGYGFASGAGEGFTASLYHMNCEPIWIKNDREYYGQSFANGRYVLSCVVDGNMRYGVLNTDGEIVVDFSYSYISPFANGLAFFRKSDSEVGIMNVDGEIVEHINDFISGANTTVFGVYEFEKNGLSGIKTFDGEILVTAEYKSIKSIGKNQDKLIIVMDSGENEEIFVFGIR